MKNEKQIAIISLILLILVMGLTGIRIIKFVQFNMNCEGYLKRAADANTIEIAKKELKKSLVYLEENNLTNGYTSILYKTPDEDIGFWYNNLKECYKSLDKISNTATELEKSNVLMKLRETLLDNNEITVPSGIAIFPYNLLFFILFLIFLIPLIIFVIVFLN